MRSRAAWHLKHLRPLVLLAALVLAACSQPSVDPEAAKPFEQAIAAYLKDQRMDMAVHRIVTLEVEEGLAQAKVSLHAKDMPTVNVRWSFSFARAPDDSWQVTSHRQ